MPHFPHRFELAVPTLGGRQYWGDVHFFRGYRIQQHVRSGRYRLLNPADFRLTSGDFAHCLTRLNEVKVERNLPEMSGRAIILIHGLFRSSKSFRPFKKFLNKKLGSRDLQLVSFDYPSTQLPLPELSVFLKRTLDSLAGIQTIDIVVHSLGGILTRTYLQQQDTQRDPRIRRLLMLGVPNYGAHLAAMLRRNLVFKRLYGDAGQQLTHDPDGFISTLPIPDFEFGVLSGARGSEAGWNPVIPGDDDGTVAVESTKLAGAADFITVKTLHTSMLWNREVFEYSLRFLQTGAFRESGTQHPIFAPQPQAWPVSTSLAVPSPEEPPAHAP